MTLRNDHRPVPQRFSGTYSLSYHNRIYTFHQDIDSLTTVYDASIVLGTLLAEKREDLLEDKTVLELGAGTGVPAILLAAAGASRVLATDLPAVIPTLRKSIADNCLGNIEAVPYAWGEDVAHLQPPFDIIVASDIVYDFDYFPHFVSSLDRLADSQTEVFLSYRTRYKDVEGWFFEELHGKFTWEEITARCGDFRDPKVSVYQLAKIPQ